MADSARRIPLEGMRKENSMNSRIWQTSLVVVLTGLTAPSAGAQVRFADRVPAQPQASSRWDTAIRNAQAGRATLGRRVKKSQPGSQSKPAPTHDQDLAMPHWTNSFSSQGTTYPYTIVGSDPSQGISTTISTVIVPYRLLFPDGGVFDASSDLVDGVTPVAGIVNSPVFKSVPWSVGPTAVGTTQFGDAMLRANFWSSIPGNHAGYHVLLSQPQILPVQVIQIPDGWGYSTVDSHGVPVGVVDFAWLADTVAATTISLGIPPQSLSMHVMSAVEGADLNGGGSLGFHDSINVGTATNPIMQPYVQVGYFSVKSAVANQGSYNGAGTSVVGHEIAEWLSDPVGDTLVPAWQDPAFPHICNNPFMEVADPLEDLSRGLVVSLNQRSYSFPEVAFLPWFTGDRRSPSVNGWYSSLNTFSSPSTTCPVFTNFGLDGFDLTGAATTTFTGVSNSVNNQMTIVGYAEFGSPASPVGFQMNFGFDPTTGATTITNPQQVYFPGSQYTVPSKVNDAGQIVGLYVDSAGKQHGFLLAKGRYSSLDFPGAVSTEALAINNWPVPTIAGDYVDAVGKVHGFVDIGGLFLPINASFATNLSVTGINDLGELVGDYDLGGQMGTAQTFGFQGFAGLLAPLNFPNTSTSPATTSTLLHAVNNKGEIAGTAEIQFSNLLRINAFLEGGGNFQPLQAGLDGFIADQALGINDAGILVGSYQDLAGVHAAIAIPAQLFSGAASSSPAPVPVAIPWK
jgi:hypothetical protein